MMKHAPVASIKKGSSEEQGNETREYTAPGNSRKEKEISISSMNLASGGKRVYWGEEWKRGGETCSQEKKRISRAQ